MNAWTSITVEELESIASAATGLHDFGNADYRVGLTVLLSDLKQVGELGAAGAAGARAILTGLLAQRLKSQERLRHAHSVIPIEKPWVILSMPRCGTTALHRLLCADPSAQGLEYWLGAHPQPRPPHQTWSANPDYRATEAQLAAQAALHPISMRSMLCTRTWSMNVACYSCRISPI